ncbi:MAG: hypothetical protein ACOCTM_02455 [Bacteroidota bacterium]
MENIKRVIQENAKRLDKFNEPYDQISGIGSLIPRRALTYEGINGETTFYLPDTMFSDELIQSLQETKSIPDLLRQVEVEVNTENILQIENHIAELRLDHDFEFWAITCGTIQDKKTKKTISFRLNHPQRRLLAELEKMRREGVPIRLILLKARQWGGSTLVQLYMSWIQLRLKTSWHSAIIADVEDQARNIRNMYSRLGKNYPKELGRITWKPFAGSVKSRVIEERGCIVGLGSAQKPDSLRSYDFAMAHLSEVSFWKDTQLKSAADLAQSLQATVPDEPDTLVVLESTAKGVGNFFHEQWLKAKEGTSVYRPFFVPWFEIENYQKDVPDYEQFIKSWGDYEWFLWDLGATIEGIYWYNYIKLHYGYDDWRMMSEYPSTATEAFQSSGRRVFAPQYVKNAEKTCKPPSLIGDVFPLVRGPESLQRPSFENVPKGRFFIWSLPDDSIEVTDRYCVFMDIGGRNDKADYTVIKVFDRYWLMEGGVPEVAAVWHGHLDQDLAAWKAAQIAQFYNEALLAIEVNSLKTYSSDGDHHLTVLDEISEHYDNLYARQDHDKINQDIPIKYGFHTNKSTKPMIMNALNAALREYGYIERDIRACHEMDVYEVKPNGSYGAVEGQHDDHVIVTAGGVWLSYDMELPRVVNQSDKKRPVNRIKNESTI